MQSGDLVDILPDGVRLREKALHRVGIAPSANCWGLWLPEEYSRGERVLEDPAHYIHGGYRQLVVVPFHPVSWPYLVRLEIKLQHRVGAIHEAASYLKEHDLDILYAQCTPSGSTHATWNVICEARDLRREFMSDKAALDRDYPFPRPQPPDGKDRSKANSAAHGFANRLATAMFEKLHRLTWRFQPSEIAKSEGSGVSDVPSFLSRRHWEGRNLLYTEDEVMKLARAGKGADSGPQQRQSIQHRYEAFTATWQLQLAYFSIYGGGQDNPLTFSHHGSDSSLRTTNGRPLEFSLDRAPAPPAPRPRMGLANFNASEHFVRIYPLPDSVRGRLLRNITVKYSCRQPEQPAPDGKEGPFTRRESFGLLHAVTEQAIEHRFNMIHVANVMEDSDYYSEKGALRLIGHFDPDDASPEQRSVALERDIRNAAERLVTVEPGPMISEIANAMVFVSTRFGHSREDNLFKLVEQAAGLAGVRVKLVEARSEPVTTTVQNRFQESDALLQILMVREGETLEQLPTGWLELEHGIALGLDMPRLRLADMCVATGEEWRRKMVGEKDSPLEPFRSDWGDERLREAFRQALSYLAAKVSKRRGI